MSTTWGKRWVVPGLLCVILGTVGKVYGDAKWYDAIALSGYAQASYMGNLNSPHGANGTRTTNVGRQFDTDSNGFDFNTFLLQVAKPVGPDDHYGFTVRLR